MVLLVGALALAVGALALAACRTPPVDAAAVRASGPPADMAVPALDLAVDDLARPPDLAVVDLARPDLARPDLAVVDLNRPDSAPPPPAVTVANLSLGWLHSCALMSDQTVRCWGDNTEGALGDGTNIDRYVPTPVVGLTGVVEIGAGTSFTCARRTDGTVYCWGSNELGKLGNGTADSANRPGPVMGIADAIQLVVAPDFGCVIRADRTVSCWGETADTGGGSLGPHVVAGLSGVAQLGLGWGFVCARDIDGTVLYLGSNWGGDLNGAGDDRFLTPVHVLDGARAIFAGYYASFAQMQDGTMRGWGWNGEGQLGAGTLETVYEPVDLPLWTGMDRLTVGLYSTCGIRGGQVWCAGFNTFRELGIDAGVQLSTPIALPELAGASDVWLGEYHFCVRTHDDEIECWGLNSRGQLGDGTAVYRGQPAPVRW